MDAGNVCAADARARAPSGSAIMDSFVCSPGRPGWCPGTRGACPGEFRSVMINNVRFMQQNRALGHTQCQECDPRKTEYVGVLAGNPGHAEGTTSYGAPFSENGASMGNTSPGLRPTEAPFTKNGTPVVDAVPFPSQRPPVPGPPALRPAVAWKTLDGVQPPRCAGAAARWSRSRRRRERE